MRRSLLSQSTTYCYLDESGNIKDGLGFISIGCGVGEPDVSTCAVGTTGACFLGDNHNGADSDRWLTTYAFDHCQEVVVYVKSDERERYYCNKLATTGDWSTRRREHAGAGKAESTSDGGWGCWWKSGYEWHNGRCKASKRFLGETCWDDSGECDNGGVEKYSELRLSCATMPTLGITTPTCIPAAFEIERNQCKCGWFDWYAIVACGAANNECNGHPCVASTGPNGWTCDYNEDNDW